MPSVLRLEAREYTGLTQWRWVLTDSSGAFLADHEVRLDDQDWRFEAAADLYGYISRHAVPTTGLDGLSDGGQADASRIVAEVGDWLGTSVLGPAIGDALRGRGTATVQVVLPEGTESLAGLPLETARVRGRSLVEQNITFVRCLPAENDSGQDSRAQGGNALRVLALFSLPADGAALSPRRERRSLVRLIDTIAAGGRGAEIRALQYGVTRDDLRDAVEDGEGWDIIHVCGLGVSGELLLETAEGQPDRISPDDLADLLELARERVRLITLSPSWPTARAVNEQRRLLHMPLSAATSSPVLLSPVPLAGRLAGRLGCAVLALRYPVDDEFAIGLTTNAYELLAVKGQPLSRAVALAVRRLVDNGDAHRQPFAALAPASPILFGGTAVELHLPAPDRAGPVSYATWNLKMAGFPAAPERFAGQASLMARVSAALAAGSGVPGVLLRGMPGGGKTACALELAYGHEGGFDRLVWYQTPGDLRGALENFALTLESNLPDFQMAHLVGDSTRLAGFLPRLTELMERRRVLLVIDNAESLLTSTGQWRDDRWSQLIGALTAHRGLGRVLMTSRYVPAETSRMRVEEVCALNTDETLLIAREMPYLNRLIRDGLPGLDRAASRRVALSLLYTAQGNPQLLELANGRAAHPEQLVSLADADNQFAEKFLAEDFLDGFPGEGFPRVSESGPEPDERPDALVPWISDATSLLAPTERDLFWFLCCLEEPDRVRAVLARTWDGLWHRLARADDPPSWEQALAAVVAQGLASIRQETGGGAESYEVQRTTAADGRTLAGDEFRATVDIELARYWTAVADRARLIWPDEGSGGVAARADRSAAPYLTRLGEFPAAARAPGSSPGIEPVEEEEERIRSVIDHAVSGSDYRAAADASGVLADLLLKAGRLTEALSLAGQRLEYAARAGLGPLEQLDAEVGRLQVLDALGRTGQVRDETRPLIDLAEATPASPADQERRALLRETLLELSRAGAVIAGDWDEALARAEAITASRHDRRVPGAEIARSRFNEHLVLLELDRDEDAVAALIECRQLFADADDSAGLGRTLSALARWENARGHGDAAVRLEQDALRGRYRAGDSTAIAASHHALGDYLHWYARQWDAAVSHHLAAALIRVLSDASGIDRALADAASDLREAGPGTDPPADVTGLCERISADPATDLASVLSALSPDPDVTEEAFADLLARSRPEPDPAQDSASQPLPGTADREIRSARQGRRNEAQFLISQAEDASRAGRPEEAAGYFSDAVAILRAVPDADMPLLARTLTRYAAEQSLCDRHEQALDAYEESAAISRRRRDQPGELDTLDGLIATYRILDLDDDRQAAERRTTVLRSRGMPG